jgi:hypothetical protein
MYNPHWPFLIKPDQFKMSWFLALGSYILLTFCTLNYKNKIGIIFASRILKIP